jgi:flagellar protein FliS
MSTAAQYRTASALGAVPGDGRATVTDPYRSIPRLMDGILARIAEAHGCLERNDLEQKSGLLRAAIALINELRGSLDLQAASDAHQDDLYDYVVRQLRNADSRNAVAILEEISHLLVEMRAAWFLLPPQPRRAAAIK